MKYFLQIQVKPLKAAFTEFSKYILKTTGFLEELLTVPSKTVFLNL